MAAGERLPAYETFLLCSGNLYRIITLPFSTLTTPRSYIRQGRPPVMLETWLRESRVRLPAVLGTRLQESGSTPKQLF